MHSENKHLLLTVREVATLLRIHRPKVYDLIKSGTIDGFKLGSDWRIKRESVEALIGQIPESFFVEDIETDLEKEDLEGLQVSM
ncbi:MAG: helix-turn-helix domain-containing protein [Bdellovibrionota bacterium]